MSDQVLPTRGLVSVVARRLIAIVYGLWAAYLAFWFAVVPMMVAIPPDPGEPVPPDSLAIRVGLWALGVSFICFAVGAVLLWRGSLSRDSSRTGWRHVVAYLAPACLIFGVARLWTTQ